MFFALLDILKSLKSRKQIVMSDDFVKTWIELKTVNDKLKNLEEYVSLVKEEPRAVFALVHNMNLVSLRKAQLEKELQKIYLENRENLEDFRLFQLSIRDKIPESDFRDFEADAFLS